MKLASYLQLHFPCQNGLLFPGKKYELRSKQDKICHSFTNSNHKGILVDIYPSSAIVRTRTFLESSIQSIDIRTQRMRHCMWQCSYKIMTFRKAVTKHYYNKTYRCSVIVHSAVVTRRTARFKQSHHVIYKEVTVSSKKSTKDGFLIELNKHQQMRVYL